MVPNFRKFVFESLDDDSKKELRALGFGGVEVDEVASEFKKIVADHSRWKVEPEGNVLKATFEYDADPDEFFDEKRIYRQMERYVNQKVELVFDFESDKLTVNWSVSQKDINLYEIGTYYKRCSEYLDYTQDSSPAEVAEDLDGLLQAVIGYEDSLGVFELIKDKVKEAGEEYFREDDEEEDKEEDLYEKKKLKFHHSDVPESKAGSKNLEFRN